MNLQKVRNHLIAAVIGNLVGMGMVAFAFRVRWMEASAIDHPFPIYLGFGTLFIFVSTSGMVRTLVNLWRWRARRRGD